MVDDAALLRSVRLADAGFLHGFSLRGGGVSKPPFDQFNLGRAVGDTPEAVAENHRRFAAAVGFEPGTLYELSQVHGAGVAEPVPPVAPEVFRQREGDALVARAPGRAVAVRTADCLAVLVADRDSGAVAAVHAGWRGVVAGVVSSALGVLAGQGADRRRWVCAIMPHIRGCCFEVGIDVAKHLGAVAPGVDAVARPHAPGKTRVALAPLVRAQLTACGVLGSEIDELPGCTACDPQRFYSYRRDGARSGRHLAAIVVRPSGP